MHYLEDNLRPLIESIVPKKTESYIDTEFFRLPDSVSKQSLSISVGTRLEIFWNKVFSDCQCNLIEPERIPQGFYKTSSKKYGFKKGDPKPDKLRARNLVDVNGKKRQVDHYVKLSDFENWKLYLESKCNMNFDTEKLPESNKKVKEVWLALGADEGAYFNPCLEIVPVDLFNEYAKLGVKIYGVTDILSKISNAPFTVEEYFTYASTVLAPIYTNLLNTCL